VSNNWVNISVSPSQPIAQLSPSQNFSFMVWLRNIQERTNTTEVVYIADMQERNFTSTKTESPSLWEKWTFNTTLENQAEVIVIIQHFIAPGSITFAETPIEFAANTLKVNIKVSSWPFTSVQNSLAFVMDAKSPSKATQQVSRSSVDSSGNVEWLIITFEEYSLYGQIFPSAVVDNKTRVLPFILNASDSSVTAIVPHFWGEVELDPSYSVLLGDGGAPNNNHGRKQAVSKTALEASLLTIGLLALVLTALYFAYPRILLALQLREGRESIQLEKRGSQGFAGERKGTTLAMQVSADEGQFSVVERM